MLCQRLAKHLPSLRVGESVMLWTLGWKYFSRPPATQGKMRESFKGSLLVGDGSCEQLVDICTNGFVLYHSRVQAGEDFARTRKWVPWLLEHQAFDGRG